MCCKGRKVPWGGAVQSPDVEEQRRRHSLPGHGFVEGQEAGRRLLDRRALLWTCTSEKLSLLFSLFSL